MFYRWIIVEKKLLCSEHEFQIHWLPPPMFQHLFLEIDYKKFKTLQKVLFFQNSGDPSFIDKTIYVILVIVQAEAKGAEN